MDHLRIFQKAASALQAGQSVALITVISTTGSTPGKVGYKMLLTSEDGQTTGTVGGGSTEAQMIAMARRILPAVRTEVFGIDLSGTQGDENGICGGRVEFLVETFGSASVALFEEVARVLAGAETGFLVSVISPGQPPEKVFLRHIDAIDRCVGHVALPPETVQSIKDLVAAGQLAKRVSVSGAEIFVEAVVEWPVVFVFGAGHLARHICRYAKSLDFRVTVCDDREQYANAERFPDADRIVVEEFERVFDKVQIDNDSYIVIVTRGHKCDELVLEQALRTDAKYIGMIGSRRKTLTILKRLSERGLPEATLRRVYSPIGISIGALTPQEIALSIACELTAIRRLGDGPGVDHLTVSFSQGLCDTNP